MPLRECNAAPRHVQDAVIARSMPLNECLDEVLVSLVQEQSP